MVKQIQGVIHGKTIELDQDPGMAEGERVDVQVRVSATRAARPWGEGIRRSAGIAAEVPGFDEAFDRVQRDRELATMRDADE
jgi:hypothetical protein